MSCELLSLTVRVLCDCLCEARKGGRMSTLNEVIAAIKAFNRRFEKLNKNLFPHDLFALEALMRVDLTKTIAKAQGLNPQTEWDKVEDLPGNVELTGGAETMFQNYLELLRMNFGIRAGKMDTFVQVRQVLLGLHGLLLICSLSTTVRQEAQLTLRAFCIQLAIDNERDAMEVQERFHTLPNDLLLTPAAKALADRFFGQLDSAF